MIIKDNEYWMLKALKLAEKALAQGEIPVGAILLDNIHNTILGEGRNRTIELNDPTAHAEIMALRLAGKNLRNYRFNNTTLYVTLEPCIMCTSALIHSRISCLVFGAYNFKHGACGSVINIVSLPTNNHVFPIFHSVCQDRCSSILKYFFNQLRYK